MQTHTIVNSKSHPQVKQPQIWDEPTALAQVGDEIRAPFTPMMQVVEREVLANGRVRLLVKPVSASYSEEWLVEPQASSRAKTANSSSVRNNSK